MSLELNLYFSDPQHVVVSLIGDTGREETDLLNFTSPLSDKDYEQIRWYLTEYATQYSVDIDFDTAGRIAKKWPLLGNILFNKVFSQKAAQRLWKKFRDHKQQGHLLTITANHPAILSLPWELLHETGKGDKFLICESPRTSVRRRMQAPHGKYFQITPKKQLHLLFVVSRPTNATFTDPRANAQQVLEALDKRPAERITVEFLRPATLKNLRERLENKERPHVDILHFDGHYVFDKEGSLQNEAKAGFKTLPDELKKQAATINTGKNTSYLLFEKDNGATHPVPAPLLTYLLNRQQIPLVILSAQNEIQENISSAAATITAMGIPFVLTINALVLVSATQNLFETFYECLAQGYKIGSALDHARLSLCKNTERRVIMRLTGAVKVYLHDWFTPVLYQHGQDTALLTQTLPSEESAVSEKTPFSASNLPKLQQAGFFGRQRELWNIERKFVRGTRRITLTGVGGQGKTYLVQEVGRWLHQTLLFKRVVFVDFAYCQGLDPVSVVVSAIATVLQKHLLDADAATKALRRVPTLLILANVDSLEQTPPHANSHNLLSAEGKAQGEGENAASPNGLSLGNLNGLSIGSTQAEGENATLNSLSLLGGEAAGKGVLRERKTNTFIIDDDDETDGLIFGDKDEKNTPILGNNGGAGNGGGDETNGGGDKDEPAPLTPLDDNQTNTSIFGNQGEINTSFFAENRDKTQKAENALPVKTNRDQDGTNPLFFEDVPETKTSFFDDVSHDEVEKNAHASEQEGRDEADKNTQPPAEKSVDEKNGEDADSQPSPVTQLLDMAKKWSETGQSCVLITTRQPDLAHPGFPKSGRLKHYQIPLGKWDEKEALRYFDTLMTLPPKPAYGMPNRDVLEKLFEQIDYNPLSINILTCHIKNDSVSALNERVERLLAALPADTPQPEKWQVASVNLSLEQIDAPVQPYLPRLSVFQGGAFENVLQAITNIPDVQWQTLRYNLEATGLVQVESINGVTVPYLKFHPGLAPVLGARLSEQERQALRSRYRRGYYEMSNFLYEEDSKNPYQARAIEHREMPNFLPAVHDAWETEEEWAEEFIGNLKSFMADFGFKSTYEALAEHAEELEALEEEDFQQWFISQSEQGQQFMAEKRFSEAQAMFEEMLDQLGETASHNRCLTLGRLGRCMRMQEQYDQAANYYRQKLADLEVLESSPQVEQEIGRVQTHLADVLTENGDYSDARKAYEAALSISKAREDSRSEAIIQAKLGTLEQLEGHPKEAEQHYHKALALFQPLNESKHEANAWYQLGRIYQQNKQWNAAVQAYRKAADMFEKQGDMTSAATTWNQLAQINQLHGNVQEAENWYRKAIEADKATNNLIGLSIGCGNLADLLLQHQPHRLGEARQLAETGLAIDKTRDPDEVEIWKTYLVLAKIADKQNDVTQAQLYRRLAREAKANYAGRHHELEQHKKFVEAVVATVAQPSLRKQLEAMLQQREGKGWRKLVAAIRRILDGERDWDTLSEKDMLDLEDALIVREILQRIQ
jgi:tetratricopeptide (TPR) repeat protein